MRHENLADVPCSIVRPLSLLGDRWTLVLLRQAFAGIRRFEDFHSTLGISRSRLPIVWIDSSRPASCAASHTRTTVRAWSTG